jgi:transcriptional regulator with XRE-family HTH domain
MGEPTEFGRILAELREAKEWSRRELAQRSGVSYDYIVKIEDGNRKDPGFSKARRLARALQVPLSRFAGPLQAAVEKAMQDVRESSHLASLVEEFDRPVGEEEWDWLAWTAGADPIEGHLNTFFLVGLLRLRRQDLARRGA